jgi:serine/threonine protein kinase
MLDAIEYMHNKGVFHRDPKLENIIINRKFNIKIIDFDAATDKSIDCLNLYRCTMTLWNQRLKKAKPTRARR